MANSVWGPEMDDEVVHPLRPPACSDVATFGKALECFSCPMPLVWSDSRMEVSQVLGKVGNRYRRIGLEVNPFCMLP